MSGISEGEYMKASGIGGQAVMEGVMMKNGDKYAVAVRKPDKDIVVDVQDYKSLTSRVRFFGLPIIRGVVAFIESMYIGVKTLTYSADFYEEDVKPAVKPGQEAKSKTKDNLIMAGTVCLSIVLAIALFMMLPYFASRLLSSVIESEMLLALCEGVFRVVLFIGYIVAISCMRDIKRVFMYHGAEHKSINCIEHGLELTVENVRRQSREHKRCGTSFLLIVMVISVLFFMFIRFDNAWLRIGSRLFLIPVIAGISYEFIKLAGRSENPVVVALSKPGLLLQKLTTAEPDDSMIEVAIMSVEAVFDWKEFLENYDKKSTPAVTKRKYVKPQDQEAQKKQQNVPVETEDDGEEELTASIEYDSNNFLFENDILDEELFGEDNKPIINIPKKKEAPKQEEPKKNEAPKQVEPKKNEAPKKKEEPKQEEPKQEEPKKNEAPKKEEHSGNQKHKDKHHKNKPDSDKKAKASTEDEDGNLGFFKANRAILGQPAPEEDNRPKRIERQPIEIGVNAPIVADGEDDDDEILRELDRFFVNTTVKDDKSESESTDKSEEAAQDKSQAEEEKQDSEKKKDNDKK